MQNTRCHPLLFVIRYRILIYVCARVWGEVLALDEGYEKFFQGTIKYRRTSAAHGTHGEGSEPLGFFLNGETFFRLASAADFNAAAVHCAPFIRNACYYRLNESGAFRSFARQVSHRA